MRGKKVDNDFVSSFVAECVKKGICLPEAIVAAAQTQMDQIDKQIQTISKLKKERSQLLDVLLSFKKPKKDKSKDKLILDFHNISNKIIALDIINSILLFKEINFFAWKEMTCNDEEANKVGKQLLQLQVIFKEKKETYTKGINFETCKEFLESFLDKNERY